MLKNNTPKKGADTLIGRLDTGKLVTNAGSIVSRAVDILEENIAEGIVIAKRLESKVIDVEKARGGDEKAVMNRFRKDAHEALDIFFDALSTATHSLNSVVERLAETETALPKAAAANKAPVLTPEAPLPAGQSATIPLRLENENKQQEMIIEFKAVNLTTNTGTALNARNISFTPRKLVIPPGGLGEMNLTVKVPKKATSGRYSGMVEDKSIPGLRAMLVVEVSS